MLLDIISLLLKLGGYFWDIGVDILVGRQQIEKTFPQYRFEGKQYHHIYEIRVDEIIIIENITRNKLTQIK